MPSRNRKNLAPLALTIYAFIALIVAIFLFQSASSRHSAYEKTADAGAESYTKSLSATIKSQCEGLAKKDRATCISNAEEVVREGVRKEYDLEAQRITAVWTAHMGIAAIIGMAASLIGVGLIWTTFRETRRATTAAMGQLDLMRESQRPDVRMQVCFETDGTDSAQNVVIVAKSFAAPPAGKISIQDVYVSTSDNRFNKLQLNQVEVKGPASLNHSGSARTFKFSDKSFVFPVYQMQSGVFDSICITVHASIRYSDVHGETYGKNETWEGPVSKIGQIVTERVQASLVIVS